MSSVSRGTVATDNEVWDVNTLTWVKMTQPGGGGGASGDVSVISSVLPSGAATSAKQDSLLTELQLKADLTETQPVSLASVPSHAITTVSTITNVVHVDDNAGSLTVDGTVALSAGSAVIGHVIVDTAPSTAVTGPLTDTQLRATAVPISFTQQALPANQSTNINQVGGVAVTQGQKVAASSIPVVLPLDSTVGTIVANSASVQVISGGAGTASLVISGTWVGSILFYGTDASSTLQLLTAVNTVTGALESTTTVNGVWILPAAGWSAVGALSFAWTSGTASVALLATAPSNLMSLAHSIPTGTNSIGQVTANAGTNLNTSLLATSAKQDSLLAVMPSTATVDGVTVAFSADWSMRRLQEAQYLQTIVDSVNTMINSESENSQRVGFELR